MYTEASLSGWGAVYRVVAASGCWDHPWSLQHVNVLELRAVRLALQRFLPYLEGRHILVRLDNTTVVAYINHQGELRSHRLHEMTRELLVWAHAHLTSVRAAHVPGVLNSVADMLSRDGPREGDWRLHRQVMQQLWVKFGRTQEDLFASQENTQLVLLDESPRTSGLGHSGSQLTTVVALCLSPVSSDPGDAGQSYGVITCY